MHVSRKTTPAGRRRDRRVAAALGEAGVDWVETGTPYAVGPGSVTTGEGSAYKVFTPFSRAWREHGWPAPATEPKGLRLAQVRSDQSALSTLKAAREAKDLPALPDAGEEAALRRWADFRDGALAGYGTDRDRADLDGTSRLSPYLKIGAVHPRTLLGPRGRSQAPR